MRWTKHQPLSVAVMCVALLPLAACSWPGHSASEEVVYSGGYEGEREQHLAAVRIPPGWQETVQMVYVDAGCSQQEKGEEIAAHLTTVMSPARIPFVLKSSSSITPAELSLPEDGWDLRTAAAALEAFRGEALNSSGVQDEVTVMAAPLYDGLHGGILRHPWDEGERALILPCSAPQKVLTHLIGHYFGLLHTWHTSGNRPDEQCNSSGDFVDDTPAQRIPSECKEQDSCPGQPGKDAVGNPMATPGDCPVEGFTKGQVDRMQRVAYLYYKMEGRCRGTESYFKEDGSDYRGTFATTVSGKPCAPWTSPLPRHKHLPEMDPLTLSRKGLGNHTFCRNPFTNDDFVGCYYVSPQGTSLRYEQCSRDAIGEPCPTPVLSPCPPPTLTPAGYLHAVPFPVTASLPSSAPLHCKVSLFTNGSAVATGAREAVAVVRDAGMVHVEARVTGGEDGNVTTAKSFAAVPPVFAPPRITPEGGQFTNPTEATISVSLPQGVAPEAVRIRYAVVFDPALNGDWHAESFAEANGTEVVIPIPRTAMVLASAMSPPMFSPSATAQQLFVVLHPSSLSPSPLPSPTQLQQQTTDAPPATLSPVPEPDLPPLDTLVPQALDVVEGSPQPTVAYRPDGDGVGVGVLLLVACMSAAVSAGAVLLLSKRGWCLQTAAPVPHEHRRLHDDERGSTVENDSFFDPKRLVAPNPFARLRGGSVPITPTDRQFVDVALELHAKQDDCDDV